VVRTSGRRMLTCHHEVGHALVLWFFGYDTDKATVLTVEEVRAGRIGLEPPGRSRSLRGASRWLRHHWIPDASDAGISS